MVHSISFDEYIKKIFIYPGGYLDCFQFEAIMNEVSLLIP